MHMPKLERQWTVRDLQDLPDDGNRYEVIDGRLVVTPPPAWTHQEAVGALYRKLANYLDRERVGHAFIAPADVVFSAHRSVQPDLFVVPLVNGRRPARFDEVGGLLLAVEVLSSSTARTDRVAKRTMYREQGVPEYWIIDLDARTVERSTPADSRVDVLADRIDWLPIGASTALSIELADYFDAVLDSEERA
jgi:Uma2 family endonuclease